MKWIKLICVFYIYIAATCFPLFCLKSQENQSLTAKEKIELYGYRLHPSSYHRPERYKLKSHLIQLNDGSIWSLNPDYMEGIQNWKKSHKLFIQPHYSYFWPDYLIVYNYIVYNLDQDAEIPIYLEKIENSAFLIEELDTATHAIFLDDKTIWKIDDQADISNWKRGQRILVGVNHEWYSAQYPHILINGDLDGNPHVPAIFLNNRER